MPQIGFNTQREVNLNENATQAQAQRTGPRADLPRELQNARPSTSVWATIGRVASYVARGLIAVPTLGISEAAIWGVRKLCDHFRASPEPPQPRIEQPQPHAVQVPRQPAEPAPLTNEQIARELKKGGSNYYVSASERFLDLGRSIVDAMRQKFGEEAVPQGTDYFVMGGYFVGNIADEIRGMSEPVSDETLRTKMTEAFLNGLVKHTVVQAVTNLVSRSRNYIDIF